MNDVYHTTFRKNGSVKLILTLIIVNAIKVTEDSLSEFFTVNDTTIEDASWIHLQSNYIFQEYDIPLRKEITLLLVIILIVVLFRFYQVRRMEDPSRKLFGMEKDILAEATEWVHDNWTADMPRIHSVLSNPGFENNCSGLRKFMSGVRQLDLNLGSKTTYFFAWHGTRTKSNVLKICQMGFNPSLRSGQSYGPGEYFSLSPTISRGYCGESNFIIVALILRGPWVKNIPLNSFCVVNNPVDFNLTYTLPILVVNFDNPDNLISNC